MQNIRYFVPANGISECLLSISYSIDQVSLYILINISYSKIVNVVCAIFLSIPCCKYIMVHGHMVSRPFMFPLPNAQYIKRTTQNHENRLSTSAVFKTNKYTHLRLLNLTEILHTKRKSHWYSFVPFACIFYIYIYHTIDQNILITRKVFLKHNARLSTCFSHDED